MAGRHLILAVPLAAIAATGGVAERAIAWETVGKGLEGDSRLPGLVRVLDGALAESLGRLRGSLGIRPGAATIRWTVDVSRSPSPGLVLDARGPGFFERGRTGFVGGGILVSLPARRYLSRPDSAAPVAAHEAVHAVMASALGTRERYEAVPRWLREGIAVWFAGEGKARVDEMIAGSLLEGSPASAFLSGLPPGRKEAPASDRVTHAEAFLAILWLERRAGEGGLRAVAEAVAAGEDAIARIEGVTGLGFDAVRARAIDLAREEVRRRIDGEAERLFGASLRLREEGREEEAAVAWRSLISRDPDGPLVPTLLYFLARGGLDGTAGKEAALEAGDRLVRLLALPDAPWRAEALVLEGERLRAAGDLPGARRAWGEVLEAYGEDTVPAGRASKLLGSRDGPGP